MTTTLSLKLPPEVANIMPWILAARKSGDPKQIAWAKREYETAQEKARWREHYERRAEERRLRFEYEQRLREEEQEREYLAWEAEQKKQEARLRRLGGHVATEDDGCEYLQPTQSSQKGWRRLLSECPDLCERTRYGMWGGKRDTFASGHHSVKHNCGRKPRKPWFK